MLHNLDFCDILVLGGDLDPRQECLELNHSELHQRHLDATNSTAGYSIYGEATLSPFAQWSLLSGWPQQGVVRVMALCHLWEWGQVWALSVRVWTSSPSSFSYSSTLRTWTTSSHSGKSPVDAFS